MARKMISVPDEMIEQMHKRPNLNWSKIAQRGFAKELAKPERDIIHLYEKRKGKCQT